MTQTHRGSIVTACLRESPCERNADHAPSTKQRLFSVTKPTFYSLKWAAKTCYSKTETENTYSILHAATNRHTPPQNLITRLLHWKTLCVTCQTDPSGRRTTPPPLSKQPKMYDCCVFLRCSLSLSRAAWEGVWVTRWFLVKTNRKQDISKRAQSALTSLWKSQDWCHTFDWPENDFTHTQAHAHINAVSAGS